MYFISCRRSFQWFISALSIHLDSSCTMLDHLGHECLTRYSSNPTPLLCLFWISYDILVSLSWLLTILLCGISGVLKVISDFMSSLNTSVILLIISGWEILRVVLARSRLIIHPTESSSSPIYQVVYYLLMHPIVFINAGLSPIYSVSYIYTMTITVLS